MLQENLLDCYIDNVRNPEMRDPKLERLLYNYNSSLDQVQEVKESISKTQRSEHNIAKRLWKTETIKQTLETKCGDQSAIKHEYNYQQAQYQTHENARLNLTLHRLRSEINTLLYRRFYEATLIRLEIQTLLDQILWELPSRAIIKHTLPNEWEDQETRKHDGITLIRLLNTLFSTAPLWSSVLKEPTEEQEVDLFEKCVRTWILQVGAVLLDLSLPSERRCLLLHLLQTKSASWAIPLLQYSFHPTAKLPVADMEEYVVAIRMVFDHRLYESKDDTRICPLPVWTEDDFLVALDQFGVAQTFCATIQEAFRQPFSKESIDALFNFADELLEALNVGMKAMSSKGYRDLAKHLGQTTCHMAQRLIENIGDENIRKESQNRIDNFVSNVVLGYLEVEEKTMYNFLPILPFHGVSIDSLWIITLRLLKIDEYKKPDNFGEQLTLPDMTQFLRFLEANQTQGIFMLGCLSNITTCILPAKGSIDSFRNSLSGCLITIVAHTLFIIAFVDTNLCDIYYKDVRDNFDPVCTCHPFVISLLLRWTYDNFSKMEGMALYLFHSLPLNKWIPQTDDLVLLHRLLCQGPSASTQVSFGRYVIEHLNFGTISGSEDLTISKSQPWHNRTMPFLPYEIHEEIAFLLLDACQKYQPLPESDKSSDVLGIVATAMSTYMVTPDQLWTAATSTIIATEFIQWAWKMALKLKLYDCPITTRASDIEKAITPAFLKDALHHHHDAIGMHHALLTYISFLLSSTSRHFLRFETSNGWLKLLLILRRGKPEAVLQVMSDIIPAFVYMHGDDFFNDESLSEFLRQMMEFKADPMLTKAALLRVPKRYHQSTFWNKQEITGIGLVIGSHAWQGHFIDSVGDLMDENGGGFSYLDLMLHSWLKTIFARKEWMWSDQYVVAIDCIAKIAFSLGRYSLVRSMLSSEHMRLEQNRSQQLLSSPKLAALGGQHRNPLRFIKNIMPDTAYTSLLAGEWTMMSLTANNLMRAPGVEAKSFWFAYEVLVMETIHDQEQRYALANAALDLIKQRKTEPLVEPEISALFKTINAQSKKPSDYLSIYRWAQHILVLPHNHPLLPLYLQIFFCLYYSSITVGDKTLLYGTYFFSKKQELLHKVRDRTAYLQTYHGQQQPSGEKGELYINSNSNSNGSISSCCSSNQTSGNNHEALRQIYYSMWLWLGNTDLLRPDFDLSTLPTNYSINRLKQCRQPSTPDAWELHQPWNSKTSLWFDLINKKQLQDAFIQFPWEGSEKFCKRPPGSIETQATVADEGSVYSSYEVFRAIPKVIPTTIQPPPIAQFNEPIITLAAEQLIDMTPKDLLGSSFEKFQHHAALFQERIKNQEDLDEAYVEQLGLLYTNTPITETLTIPCVQMPQGICKKPAQLTLSATFVETNTEVRQQIEQNRKEAKELIFDSIDTSVCHEALVGLKNIESITTYYTEVFTKKETQEDTRCLHLSWSCLIYAIESFENGTEIYPPFRLFLRQMARSLADLLNSQSSSAERLLQLMAEKEGRVVILYPAFRPNVDSKNIVSMHKRISSTDNFGARSQLYLLSAFDMAAWGATEFATKNNRDTFYENSFVSLKKWMEPQTDQIDVPTIASIRIQQYKLSLALMAAMLEKQPQDMEHVTLLGHALDLLSETDDTKEADGFSGAMIDSLTESLGGRSRKVLDILNTNPDEMRFRLTMLSTLEEVTSLVDYLGSYLSNIASKKGETGDLFGVFGYASPALCRLMVNVLCDERIMDKSTNIVVPVPSFWTRTTECFHGWWQSSDSCAMSCGESNHAYSKREYLPFFAEAYGHLIKRMLILVSPAYKANLLGVLFDYYHENIITHHSDLWLDRFHSALSKLPWGFFEMSEAQLNRMRDTWSLLEPDDPTKRIVYLGFTFVILRSWLKKYTQKKETVSISRSWLKSYFQVFFIFLQDSINIWPVEKERSEALQILYKLMIEKDNIDTIIPEDIEETLLMPTERLKLCLGKWADDKDTSTTPLCVQWVREMTRFDEKETPMRMKKVFSDFVMKLLSESPEDQSPPKDVQEYWVNNIWTSIDNHTEYSSNGTFDPQLKDLMKSMLDNLYQDRFEAGWNILVKNAEQSQPETLLALFSALLSIQLSPKTTRFMERCLEKYLQNSKNEKIPQVRWNGVAFVVTNSKVDTTLLLKYCMDKSFLLTIRAYCEAMIQQNQNAQAKQVEFAEEIAAIVSITKIQTSEPNEAKKMTYLIQQFSEIFCKNKADTLKKARLVAGLISLSRTTARWANPGLPLSNATPNGINDPKPLPACLAWQHFSLLLDSFLALRLEEAGMGASSLTPSRVSLEDRVKRLESIRVKKNVAFDEALSRGVSIIRDNSQWDVWKLDEVVSQFSDILFI